MSLPSYFVSIAEDPERIRRYFPEGVPWAITPRVYVMKDGPPRNDPESGRFEVPRIRDSRFTRTAAIVALRPKHLKMLSEPPDGDEGVTLAESLEIQLYPSREAAYVAHPEFEWRKLGVFAGARDF